jgi:hypothetical protein
VSDGFTHEAEVMQLPSVTKTFGASHTWLWALSTDVFGSRPMRAVPISWMPMPGKYWLSYVRTFFTPVCSSMSAMSAIMSLRMRASFSPVAQSILSTGSPHLSFFVPSREIMFA